MIDIERTRERLELLAIIAKLEQRLSDLAVLLPEIRELERMGHDVQARPLWDDAIATAGGRA